MHRFVRAHIGAALAALTLAACQQDATHLASPDVDGARGPAPVAALDGAPEKQAPSVTMTDVYDATCSTNGSVGFRFADADGAEDGPWSYTVDWGDGTASSGAATPGQVIAVARAEPYASQGAYAVVVTVTDGSGLAGTSRTLLRFECNPPPVAVKLALANGTCTSAASLAFDVDDTPSDGPWSYTIAWGDGSEPTTGSISALTERVSATHAYAANGAYEATVTVVERRGQTTTSRHALSHDCNRPPVPAIVARSGGTCSTTPAITFAVADEDGVVDGPWTYEVSWGDGSDATAGTTALATNVLAPHTYAVSGSYTVTVTVTDKRGLTGTATTELVFDCSRPPTPIVSALVNGSCSTTPSLTFVVADLDGAVDAPWAYEVDWGDGSAPQTGSVAAVGADVRLPHAYAVSGQYTVTIRATDKRGREGATSTKLTYDCSRPPVPTVADAASGSCTAASSLTFSVDDPDGAVDGPWSYEVAWGDGTTPTTGSAATLGAAVSESHAYATSGTYTATVKVTDRRGVTGTTSRAITYYCNRAPTATVAARANASCTAGASLSFAVGDADGASDGPWSWTITWGDGTTSSGSATTLATPVAAPHSYLTNGSWDVAIKVTDRRGLSSTVATTLGRSCEAASCVAGAGFWKSHEGAYAHPYAATAPWLRGGPAAPTWDAVLGDPKSAGNTYLQLAAEWGAATLNRARGAPMSAAVLQVLDESEAWLRAKQNGNGSLPTLRDVKAEGWKDTLESYNGGKLGAPVCN